VLQPTAVHPIHLYEVRPRKDHRGVDLISDCCHSFASGMTRPIMQLATMHSSRSHDAMIRVYDEAGNVIETHEHKADFKEW
jgi:hypothetical protein